MPVSKKRRKYRQVELPNGIRVTKVSPLPSDPIDLLELWQRDISAFVLHMFGVHVSPQQRAALEDIVVPGSHVSIRSGHGTGKTTLLAWVVLWFLFCHREVRVPCTAPSGHQLKDLLWAEMSKWIARIPFDNLKQYDIKSDSVSIIGYEKDRFAVARTARPENPEALAGFHAKNMIFIIDEASGVHEKVFETAEGALSTPGARIVMTSNPTRLSGYFYRSHHKERKGWKTHRWSSDDSPLVTPKYAKTMADRYGKDSNVYRVRVLGEFPTGGDDVVIPLDLVISAQSRDGEAHGMRRAGLDVARYGDDSTVLTVRAGARVTHISQWRGASTTQTVGKVVAAFRAGLFDCVFVDTIGIGAGVADQLREIGLFPVYDVNVSESAASDRYMRLRDELWFRCRDWFNTPDATLPAGEITDALAAQACAVTFHFSPNGKYQVQSKDDIKKDGGESPDIADSLCLTFADTETSVAASTWSRGAV